MIATTVPTGITSYPMSRYSTSTDSLDAETTATTSAFDEADTYWEYGYAIVGLSDYSPIPPIPLYKHPINFNCKSRRIPVLLPAKTNPCARAATRHYRAIRCNRKGIGLRINSLLKG